MHIPDGYLSPIFSLSAGLVTVPAWMRAVKRVRALLNHRTIPLMAMFAAFAFTLMMFNVPVPGGTTAHAVGGTLIAVVLGPWTATLCLSIALIIQALFFGDGGILAIFINCLNVGIILPFVGYSVYRLLAGRSALSSLRRVWAAGIGAYFGLSATALAVGLELGMQPLLFSQNGHPLYSPYPIGVAVSAMLISNMLGASLVEALVTALGFAYLQRHYPHFLIPTWTARADPAEAEQPVPKQALWKIFTTGLLALLLFLLVVGLVSGRGDIGHLFGTDWSQVAWPDIGALLVLVLIVGLILLPLTWFLSPRRWRKVCVTFMTGAIIAPLGLIAPGFAFAEGSPDDIHAAFGYIPQGLQQFSGIFSAPLSGYNVPVPFFADANAPLWHAAIGYEISGIVGIVLIGGLLLVLALLLHRRGSEHARKVEPV